MIQERGGGIMTAGIDTEDGFAAPQERTGSRGGQTRTRTREATPTARRIQAFHRVRGVSGL